MPTRENASMPCFFISGPRMLSTLTVLHLACLTQEEQLADGWPRLGKQHAHLPQEIKTSWIEQRELMKSFHTISADSHVHCEGLGG